MKEFWGKFVAWFKKYIGFRFQLSYNGKEIVNIDKEEEQMPVVTIPEEELEEYRAIIKKANAARLMLLQAVELHEELTEEKQVLWERLRENHGLQDFDTLKLNTETGVVTTPKTA